MKTILCYGDSNTWGVVANTADFETSYIERFPRDARWTGLLQKQLGHEYHVIEEGLNGRTTNVDYREQPGLNGKTYLLPCLYSQSPIDLIVLFLGCNDLKKEFKRSAKDISNGMEELIKLTQSTIYGSDMCSPPDILLVEYPSLVNEDYRDMNNELIFSDGIERSKAMSPLYANLAKKYNCHFLETNNVIKLTPADGIHLDKDMHRVFAELVAGKVRGIFT